MSSAGNAWIQRGKAGIHAGNTDPALSMEPFRCAAVIDEDDLASWIFRPGMPTALGTGLDVFSGIRWKRFSAGSWTGSPEIFRKHLSKSCKGGITGHPEYQGNVVHVEE